MRRGAPSATVELEAGCPRLRFLPRAGQPDLEPIPLHPLLAVVLHFLEREWSIDDLAGHLAERLANPAAAMREIVEDAGICFRSHLAAAGDGGLVRLGDVEPLLDELAGGGPYVTRDVVFPGDRALFPLTVQWLVTRYCNRQCIYCYAGATPGRRARDADLERERLFEILDEAARLGAYNLFLTGGEPLLREESYDVIVHGLELGMEPEIVSKQFIPAAEARRLAAAGLGRIFLSIDSLDPEVARELTGVRTFARDIARTVERLVGCGIAVYAKTVLTSRNVATLPATLEGLERLGVGWVGIEPYARNLQRHSDSLAPSEEQLQQVREWVAQHAEHNGSFTVDFNDRAAEEETACDLGEDSIVCHNGVTALLFLPDGRVSRCDKRLPGGDLVVGDLKTQSVQQVWGSPAMLASLKPPRELYRGTLCHDCASFETCHQRGRCFYDAYLTGGTLYGPQAGCPYLGNGARAAC